MGDQFANTSILNELYLNGNSLKHIETDILVHSTILSAVTLGGNPWECNCQLDPLRLWLNEYGNLTLDLQETTCFRTKVIIAFHDSFCEEQGEEQNPLRVVVGILSATLFVLVVGSVIIYRLDWTFKCSSLQNTGFVFLGNGFRKWRIRTKPTMCLCHTIAAIKALYCKI